MKLLFDECTPHDLAPHFAPHEVTFVEDLSWKGKKNGQLLRLAAGLFAVLITTDVNLYSQQKVEQYDLAVLVLRGYRNSYEELLPLVSQALKMVVDLAPGTLEFIYVGARSRQSDRRRQRGPFAKRPRS